MSIFEPVIDPLVNVTAPTVSMLSPKYNVPPLIVTAPVSAKTVPVVELALSNVKVPALTFVPPV